MEKIQELVMSYRDNNEKGYFGSDFNKWVSKKDIEIHGRPSQTINNIDCVQFKMIGNEVYMRVIESKHYSDHYGQNQKDILDRFSSVFKLAPDGCIYEVYTLWGAPPYNTVILDNHMTGQTKRLNHDQLVKFALFQNIKGGNKW